MAFGSADVAKMVVDLSLKGNFLSQLSKVNSQLSKTNAKLEATSSRAYKAGQQIGTGVQRGVILAAGAFGILTAAVVKSVGAAGDFEAQLNTINTIAFANAADLKAIGDGIREIAKRTGLGLDDLTASYYDLLSAGVKTKDAQAVLNDAVTLGIGGLASTAEAVDLLTTAYNAYGLDAVGAAKATDMFAQAVADGKVKASEIAATFANVASIAKAYNVGIDQIAASYGFLTAQGVPAAEVTTEMNRALISLIKPSKSLAKAQQDLGVNFTSIVKKQGLVPALQILRQYSDKTGIPLIELLGRVEAVKYALQTTGPNAKGFAAELDRIRHSGGEAAKQMAEREQGLNFQIGRLRAILKDASITIGSALLPKLVPALAAINDLITKNQDKIAAFGQTLADAFTTQGVVDGVTALSDAFGQMVHLAQVAAGPVKAIVGAFLSLPKGVQTALVAGFAVNKLTGGLVTNAVGGIAEMLGRSLGIIKAPLVNVQGGVVKVGGPGSGGLPGGGGGGGLNPFGVATAAAIGLAIAAQWKGMVQDPALQAQTDSIDKNTKAQIDNQVPLADLQKSLAATKEGIYQLSGKGNPLVQALSDVLYGGQTEALRATQKALEDEIALRMIPVFNGPMAHQGGLPPRGGELPRMEANRGRMADALSSAEIGRAAAAGVKQGIGPDIEAVRAAIDAQKPADIATAIQTAAGQRDAETSSSIQSLITSTDLVARSTDIESLRGKIADGLTTNATYTQQAGQAAALASQLAGNQVAGAIQSKDLSINQAIDIKVNVSAAGVTKSVTVQNRAGPGNGSSGSDDFRGGKPAGGL